MNSGDRVLKHAKRAKAKFLVVCAGSLTLAAALIVAAPNSRNIRISASSQ